jgi:hypothetical protein
MEVRARWGPMRRALPGCAALTGAWGRYSENAFSCDRVALIRVWL